MAQPPSCNTSSLAPSSDAPSSALPAGLRLAAPVDAEGEAARDPLTPGMRVGPYEVSDRIGAGGMGVVYRAYDHELRRHVVLKVLTTRGQSVRDEALLAEARIAANLEHERFVRIYALERLPSGEPFVVMELLRGQTLAPWLARRPSPRQVAAVLAEVALGMAFAHERGLIHRDLKPENIFLTREGQVKILDLGLAGLYRDPSSSTAARANLPRLVAGPTGTLPYIAPESWRDAPPRPGVDVWALGVMLYQTLAGGQHPYWSATLSLENNIARVQSGRFPRLPRAPAGLSAIVRRALRVDPELRYPDAGAFYQALQGYLQPRHRWAHRLLIGGALAGGAATALVLWRLWRESATMVALPGGSFQMGSTAAELAAVRVWCEQLDPTRELCQPRFTEREQPVRQVRVSPFALDRTEVMVGAFLTFAEREMAAGRARLRGDRYLESASPAAASGALLADLFQGVKLPHPLVAEAGRLTSRRNSERLPISRVTWEGARRYCAAQGKRLPTEAEWEYAARSAGTPGQRFPFGAELPDCAGVSFARSAKTTAPAADRSCPGEIGPRAVGQSPRDRTRQGIYDLGGNLSEWVADPFLERYPECGACLDPRVPEGALDQARPRRSLRGGNWAMSGLQTRAAARWSREVNDLPLEMIGFRCAQSR